MLRCLLPLLLASLAGAADTAISVTGASLGGRSVLLVRAPATQQLSPALAARLRQPLSVDWRELSVAEACARLARLGGLPIVVEPALRAEADATITLQVEAMRADRLLRWIAALGRVELTPLHGGIYVSRQPPALPQRLAILAVDDLVAPVADFPGPELAVPEPGGRGALIGPGRETPAPRLGLDELAELVEAHAGR